MTLDQFLKHAQHFSDLGWAIQEQLVAVAGNGHDLSEQNGNALRLADERFLRPLLRDLRGSDDPELDELREEIDQLLFAINHPEDEDGMTEADRQREADGDAKMYGHVFGEGDQC